MRITTITAFVLSLAIPLAVTNSQTISDSLNTFSIHLLGETINQGGDSLNIALSTYTVWALMTLVSEGSRENTLRQIETTLRLPTDKDLLRNDYQNLTKLLTTKTNGVTLDLSTGVFVNKKYAVKRSFEDVAKVSYNANVNPVDFSNPTLAANVINKYVAQATNNRIPKFVSADDMIYSQLLLISTLFFKGEWTFPFTESETHEETFYDEKNNKIGEVDMMFRTGRFPYARFEDINSHVVELPYGNDKKMSMIVILPFKGESLSGVLNLMSRKSFSSIIKVLEDMELMFVDESVYVYLPKFKIVSNFNLNIVLSKMGIKDVFSLEKANLLGMFDQYLYLSRLIQRAEIEVNEKGTVAAAASGAAFPNKSIPPRFKANRPFLYFILNKITKSIVFAGKVSNPKTLK